MLRFASKPDRVFRAILHAALACRRDEIAEYAEFPGSDPEEYREAFPTLARFFSPEAALDVTDRPMKASRARTLYHLTDYRALVLYDCLLLHGPERVRRRVPERHPLGRDLCNRADRFRCPCGWLLLGHRVPRGPRAPGVEPPTNAGHSGSTRRSSTSQRGSHAGRRSRPGCQSAGFGPA